MLTSGLHFPNSGSSHVPVTSLSFQVHDQTLPGAARAPLGCHLHSRQCHQHPHVRNDAAPLDLLVAVGGCGGSRTSRWIPGACLRDQVLGKSPNALQRIYRPASPDSAMVRAFCCRRHVAEGQTPAPMVGTLSLVPSTLCRDFLGGRRWPRAGQHFPEKHFNNV